jgi:flagellar biosynthesis protein FlhB
MNIQEMDPITVQIKFDDMSSQMQKFLYFSNILLILILLYINLIIFDFIIKRIIFYKQKRLYYVEIEDERN